MRNGASEARPAITVKEDKKNIETLSSSPLPWGAPSDSVDKVTCRCAFKEKFCSRQRVRGAVMSV